MSLPPAAALRAPHSLLPLPALVTAGLVAALRAPGGGRRRWLLLGLFDPTPPISCTTTTNTLQQHTNHSLVCPESALARDAHRSCPGGAYTDPPNIQTHNSNHLSTTRAFVASWPLMIAVNARLPKLSLWWCDGCPPGSTFLARRGTLKGDDSGVGWHQRSIVLCSTVVAGHQTTNQQASNPGPVTVHMWKCQPRPPTAH